MESLTYLLIYFLCGMLLSQHLNKLLKKLNYHCIMQQKEKISPMMLCTHIPQEFQIFLEYARNLPFDSQPNYVYLHELFQNLLESEGHHNLQGCTFDWEASEREVRSLLACNLPPFAPSGSQSEGMLNQIANFHMISNYCSFAA